MGAGGAYVVVTADPSFLKLGLTYPLPMGLTRDFASKVETLYIIEEPDPFMEQEIKAADIPCVGKELTGKLYELNPQLLRQRLFGQEAETAALPVKPVSRPPALCPGCPHRGFFYTLAKNPNFVVAGDIGCYTLGSAAPLSCMDVCVCMGGGFSVGMGMSKYFAAQGVTDKVVFGVMGNSTFFHSGMAGHQQNPGTGHTLLGAKTSEISVEEVLKACGYQSILVIGPQDLTAMQKAVDDAVASPVPAVIDSTQCVGCTVCA